jgi:superoxide dismutase, Cu-Zn family
VGDLGNVTSTSADTETTFYLKDRAGMVALDGITNVIGRSVVLHHDEDDLGTQDNEGSRTTGNAGARIACGVIAVAAPF